MVIVTIHLTCRTPLNIGSGAQQGTLARRGMLKDRRGWPYVPAATFKGRLRHAVEQVAKTLTGTSACDTHQDMCRTAPCPVCQLFGSPWQVGALRFANLVLVGPPEAVAMQKKERYPRTTERMGVAINRQRHVAEDDLLYSTELFWPGIPLKFEGVVEGDINKAQAGLLVAGLHLLPAIGRGKTGGLGWLQVEATVKEGDTLWTPEILQLALTGDSV